ncbi:hypothetical protein N7478_007181 [Penicillium angulare]|uniref:uncharacterized protein n=1 Tax=Penicillium angulare TaxID=116970 RepID=UPI0025401D4A|nr:uncharacterized protein N7478_007181 [Penicillium angulare]KAJ5281809.1 hypothetical protein N7478_007181 [Penicillium angulare]
MSSPRASKRRRIYRACDQCRRRKSKCDGEQPVCSICISTGRNCSYETGGGRRGLAPGYVRGLEVILGLVSKHCPDSEILIQEIISDSRGSNFLRSKAANNALGLWRKSKLSKSLGRMLSPSDEVGDELDSGWEPGEEEQLDQQVQDRDERMDDPSPRANNIMGVSRQLQTPAVRVIKAPNPLDASFPEDTPDLLDFYFTYTHCWLPIVERRELLRAMHLGPEVSTPGTSSSRLLLWSVIIYSSTMGDVTVSGLPSPSEIQLGVQQQTLDSWDSLDLAHIQASLILSLIHIATGNISLAWNVVGQAIRMLWTLPPSTKKNRFTHTFNGAVFLDNILSVTLGKTPGLSNQEQMSHGPVEEDDVDEWDIWTAIPRANINNIRKTPMPLRALSTFNAIRQLMDSFVQKAHHQVDTYLLTQLIQSSQSILQKHPYQRQNEASPPLLILHLTSAFIALALLRRFEQVSLAPPIIDLCVRTIHQILELLNHYAEIMGDIRPSPLASCFALQCQQCLPLTSGSINNTERENIERQIIRFSQPFQPVNPQTVPRVFQVTPSIQVENGMNQNVFDSGAGLPQSIINESILPAQSHTSAMDISVVPPGQDSVIPGGIEGYDALFEEMVTSFPSSRQEPVFAHNLGFYDGDLDTDFLAHLQHPPAS